MIHIKKVDLANAMERAHYSEALKQFESEFSYPLGEQSFQIKHGFGEQANIDYFSFFEQLGQVNYFVAQDKDRVVGAGCSVLRKNEDGEKYWYFCDFKVTEPYRGKKILEKMMAKYFLLHIVKSSHFVAVNMTQDEKEYNGLVKKIKQMFWFSNVQIDFYHLHQWENKEGEEFKKTLLNNNSELGLYTNIDKKDIVINQTQMPLYHLAQKTNQLNSFKEVSENNLPKNATVMYSVLAKEDTLEQNSISGKILLIRSGLKKSKISTLEI